MRLQKLSLKNWRVHTDRVFDFGSMNLLLGPNGSGKTSVFDAILFALLGSAGIDGSQEDSVGQLGGGTAEIALQATHAGELIEITRTLATSGRNRQTLRFGGSEITKANDIRAKVLEILGVSETVLRDYIFVSQWSVFSLLTGRTADRTQAWSSLFGLTKAEQIWRALDRAAPEPPASVEAEVAAAERELQEAVAEIDRLTELQPSHELAAREAADRRQAAQEAVAKRAEAEALEGELARVQSRRVVFERSRAAIAARLLQLPAGGTVVDLRKLETEYTERQNQLCFVEGTLAAIIRLQEITKALHESKPPQGFIPSEDWDRLRRDIYAQEMRLRACHEFTNSGLAACPTCGTKTDSKSLKQSLAQTRSESSAIAAWITEMRRSLAASEAFYGKIRQLTEDTRTPAASLRAGGWSQAIMQQVFFGHTAAILARDAILAECLTRREQCVTQLAEAKLGLENGRRIDAAAGEAANLQSRLQEADHEIAYLKSHEATVTTRHASLLAGLPDKDELTKAHEAWQQVENAARELSWRLTMLQGQRQRNERSLAALRRKHLAHVRARTSRDRVLRLRSVFHRDQLPRALAASYCVSLLAQVNKTLNELDVDFRVESLDLGTIRCRFSDGRNGDAAQILSGGQKVILALAMRVEINSLFAADLGLLCLDEPTAGLDYRRAEHLSALMMRLRQICDSRNLQLLLITHEPGCDSWCDRVFDFSDGRHQNDRDTKQR